MIGWGVGDRLPDPWTGRSLFAPMVTAAVGGSAAASDQDTGLLALAGRTSLDFASDDLPLLRVEGAARGIASDCSSPG